MQTILDILTLSADYLAKRGVENPRREAEELLSEVLHTSRMDLYLSHDKPVDEKELQTCRDWLKRRAQGEPLQYIVGSVDFLDCRLEVSHDVLIPRPETEILADTIVKVLSRGDMTGKHLWDVCCGSGCLGIAIKKKIPQLHVSLIDICPKALAVAKKNAAGNQVELDCILGDLWAPMKGKKADFFVCNPPYIAEHEYLALQREVRDYEPKKALISGDTGIEFYRRIAEELPEYLHAGAKVWLEIGDGQGPRVLELFNATCWRDQKVDKDWSGRDRFFSLEIE